ncbi:DinB family protein [Cytophagaceae bacterium 50C-KIRBA]|uniref:DinB family protein n=1 Tax=Aquirufa beregesia TaxID=2516556 RepID=A0ABX0EZY1_9BACT|nr:DinB family protein [Aquirufa beregesia]NGZ45177.1 DinB family protein [Aquirufa beregesia]
MFPPASYEYPKTSYFAEYLNFESTENLFEVLDNQSKIIQSLYQNLSPDKWAYAYAPEKWTLQQLLGHMVDTERILSYRTLCISRGEQQSLPGFDENVYLENAHYENQNPDLILQQYRLTRQATTALFQSFSPDQWNTMGKANGNSVSVRAISWMIAGHEKHHLRVIEERYTM